MSRRAGLGRGLDALLPTRSGDLEGRGEGWLQVAVDALEPNPRQPRRDFDEGSIAELAASIAQLGLLQPLLVRRRGERYELIAGERRLRAARAAGLSEVPVVVVETDDRGALERALVENVQREDLNPLEEAAAYAQLIDEAGMTHEQLGERLGRSRVTITNALRLLELPAPIQRLLAERKLSAGHGRALLGLNGNPFQERLARRVAQEGLSVRATEELVRRYQQMSATPQARSSAPARPAMVVETQRLLADHLQTRVRIEMGKRKGRVVVDFATLDELERLTRAILGRAQDPGDPRQ